MLSIRIDSIESTRLNRHESFPLLSIRHPICARRNSVRIEWLIQIDWSLLPRFKNKEDSCIIISQILTSGSADWHCANQVKSLSASDKSTQFGCIGHGWLSQKRSPHTSQSKFHLDLLWWHTFLEDWYGISFWLFPGLLPEAEVEVSSDAAGSFGYGTYMKGHWFAGSWVLSQQLQSICLQWAIPYIFHSSCLGTPLGQETCPFPFWQWCGSTHLKYLNL